MAVQCGPIGRRQTLAGLGAAGVAAAAPTIGSAQTKVAPITVVINQSPWFDSFRKTVELYEKETGNKVELDVNPFAGSLEKQRNSVRARQGQYDLLIMNSGWFAEMYFGGCLEAPQTFAELEANARKLNKPPRQYGIVQRGARGPASVSFDYYPYLYGFGGSVFKDQAAGDYSVVLNSEQGRTALDYYIRP